MSPTSIALNDRIDLYTEETHFGHRVERSRGEIVALATTAARLHNKSADTTLIMTNTKSTNGSKNKTTLTSVVSPNSQRKNHSKRRPLVVRRVHITLDALATCT